MNMESEVFRLACIALSVLVVLAFFTDWIVKDRQFLKSRIKNRNDESEYVHRFLAKGCEIRSGLTNSVTSATENLLKAKSSREAAELSIRHIEMLLVDQDKLGFVTSGSELDVVLRQQLLDRDEASFIEHQQMVHAHVEKVRDYIFAMQSLSKRLSDWRRGKRKHIQDECDKLITDLEGDAHRHWELTKRMLTEADRDPVGIAEELATPRVLAFRKKLRKFRSQVRTELAEKK